MRLETGDVMKRIYIVLTVLCLLSACGGGSSNEPSIDEQNNSNDNDTIEWEIGVYPAAQTFEHRCENVRTFDDINGDPYPDQSGSTFEEQMWLRSWSHETYLWYDEITDRDPALYNSAQAYFEVLKTDELTSSGANKDNFHFYQDTSEYESFSQSGTSLGYGINWVFFATSPPRDLRVSYVDQDSSADQAGVERGDKLISVDGVDFITSNNVDFLNTALFPSDENLEYEFVFERIDGTQVSLNLTSGDYETSFVNNVQTLSTNAGTVGYLRFDGFQRTGQTPLIDAFDYFVDENITDLVIDLRYNGGGLLAMSSQLAYMIAGPSQTDGHNFETLKFNDANPNTNPVTGATITPTPFYTREIDWDEGVLTSNTLPSVNLTRLYVIATDDTCSASEALINGLRGIDVEVILIGDTTCGKPYGFYPTDNCGTTYFTIQFQGVNDKGFGDYAEGFKPRSSPVFDDELPGCIVSDDLSESLGSVDEDMLEVALARLVDGECPQGSQANALNSSHLEQFEEPSGLSVFDPRYRSLLLENKINQPIK